MSGVFFYIFFSFLLFFYCFFRFFGLKCHSPIYFLIFLPQYIFCFCSLVFEQQRHPPTPLCAAEGRQALLVEGCTDLMDELHTLFESLEGERGGKQGKNKETLVFLSFSLAFPRFFFVSSSCFLGLSLFFLCFSWFFFDFSTFFLGVSLFLYGCSMFFLGFLAFPWFCYA